MIARENTELRQQLLTAQNLLMATAIDAGRPHGRIAAIQAERDVWCAEAGRLPPRNVCKLIVGNSDSSCSKSCASRDGPM